MVALVGKPHQADSVFDGGPAVGSGGKAASLPVQVQHRLNLMEHSEQQSPTDRGRPARPVYVAVMIREDQFLQPGQPSSGSGVLMASQLLATRALHDL